MSMLKVARALREPQFRWVSHLLVVAIVAGLVLSPFQVAQATTAYGPVVVRPGGAQLYSEPDGEVIATLPTSTIFTARGRTVDALWLMGETVFDETAVSDVDGAGKQGWLQVTQVIAVGVELLPVVDGTTSVAVAATVPETNAPETNVTGEAMTNRPVTITATLESGDLVTTALVTGTVASGDARLNVRSGPDTTYAIVAKALPGESYTVVGRTADGAWLEIDRGNGDTGWVSAAFLELTGDLATLPVVAISPPRADSPTDAAPAQATAAPEGAAVASIGESDLVGTLVIESSPGGMLYGYTLESGKQWPLTDGFDPAVSPDGQTVAFVRDGDEHGLYLIGIDGSGERLIFAGRARLSSPKWSPDGQWLLFTRGDEEYHCIEFGSGCISPPSGPDGREIAIPGADTATRYWYKLARVDVDGNNYRDIASLPSARAADWHEAGIVYQSDAGLQLTADVPDAENRLIIFDYLKPFFSDPDWQPQGDRIVYMGKEASHWEIFAVNSDGSGKVALTRPATTVVDVIPSNVAPVWSPDGQHIAFLSNRDVGGEAGAWRVWVMDADGGNQRVLPFELEIDYTFGAEQSISWAS